MLLSSFESECLQFDDAQFLIAIALSFLGEKRASAAVLTFLPLGNITPTALLPEVEKERARVKALVEKSKSGVLGALIDYLYENAVLDVRVRTSNIQTSREMKSLKDLLLVKNPNVIYEKCMTLQLRCRPCDFLCLYMRTDEYWAVLAGDIRKGFSRSANKVDYNVLNDAVIAEIAEDFNEFIKRYSSHGYQPSTCTPVPYLRNAFSSFYSVTESSQFYKILNTKGQDFEIGDGGMTAVDTIGIKGLQRSAVLNFIEVCSKINRASRLLFSHSNNAEAFYDIYSYHRDFTVEADADKLIAEYKTRVRCGCQLVYEKEEVVTQGHRESLVGKKKGRTALCEVMEQVVTSGINRAGVSRLYSELLLATSKQSTKNGARLFRTSDVSTKHNESNGEMLRILIDGYIALRALLQYLETEGRSIGVTINSFPIKIFRDVKYLKRFNSLDEYIKYVDDVSILVSAVDAVPERSAPYAEGLYSNDSVYDMLARNSLVHSEEFAEWRSMPLSYIPTAIESILQYNDDDALHSEILRFKNDVLTRCVAPTYETAVLNSEYLQVIQALDKSCKLICASDIGDIMHFGNIHYCIEFFILLERAMFLEDHPIVDDSDCYLIEKDTIAETFDYLVEAAQKQPGKNSEFIMTMRNLRIITLHKLLYAFTGVDKTQKFDGTFEELRNVFSILEMYRYYMQSLVDMVSNFCHDGKDLFLTLAQAAACSDVIELPRTVTSVGEIAYLYNAGARQFKVFRLKKSAAECAALDERRNSVLVIAMNKLLETMDCYSTIETLNHRVHIALKEVGTAQYDDALETKLRSADRTVMQIIMNGNTNTLWVRHALKSDVLFDEYHYAVSHGKRLCIDRTYYHEFGYKVTVRRDYEEIGIVPMTESDIDDIRLHSRMS